MPDALKPAVEVSVVVPLYNERENLEPLYHALDAALRGLGKPYEMVLVDDGSADGTEEALRRLSEQDPSVKVVRFARNFGQTAAMAAGFDHARGRVIVPMDGDMQNDPSDIPKLLAKVDEGYDVVSGWRVDRQDNGLRRLPSWFANRLISLITGVKLHDYGCTLKAYRSDLLKAVRLYGEMHRFIPALADNIGARICELPVKHHPRVRGKSKYGIKRTFKVVLDLVTVKFLSSYSTKPIYVFGGIGTVLCSLGVLTGAVTLWQKYFRGVWVHRNPLILAAVFLFTIGMNFLLMGLLAEIIVRTYHESQRKPIYRVREVFNLAPEA